MKGIKLTYNFGFCYPVNYGIYQNRKETDVWDERKHTLIALFRTLKVYMPNVYYKPTIRHVSPEICGIVQGKTYTSGIYICKAMIEITQRLNEYGKEKEPQD